MVEFHSVIEIQYFARARSHDRVSGTITKLPTSDFSLPHPVPVAPFSKLQHVMGVTAL